MANFDLSKYQTVQDRIDLFWKAHPAGRFNIEIVSLSEQQVVMKAEVWTDISEPNPRAVDYAEERFGSSPVNKSSFIENCATSVLGRAISQLGGHLSPKGLKPSREEMEKVQRVQAEPEVDWIKVADDLAWQGKKKELIDLYNKARRLGAPAEIVAKIKDIGSGLAAKENPAK